MYATTNIGNLRMTRELLEGNPRTPVYVDCNANTRVRYASCNGDSCVCKKYIASWFEGKCIPGHAHL